MKRTFINTKECITNTGKLTIIEEEKKLSLKSNGQKEDFWQSFCAKFEQKFEKKSFSKSVTETEKVKKTRSLKN